MATLENLYRQYLSFILLPILFFFTGYQTKLILNLNIDFYFNFSHLTFFLISSIFILSLLLPNRFKNKYNYELFILLFISSFIIGLLLSILQTDLINTRWLVHGLFDTNDADDYFTNSTQLIINDSFYSAKGRIIYPIYYAGLMRIFNFNIPMIQIFVTVVCSITIYLTSLKIFREYNFFCSLLYCFLAVDFIHENIGGNCTEVIGFILGSLAFIFFLELKTNENLNYKIYFVFFLIIFLAYLFRPGPPLIIPCLIAGCYALFYNKNFKINLKAILYPFISLLIVVAIDKLLKISFSPDSPSTFINAIDSWYATIELGNFIKENKFHQIPSQMWNLIYEHNPSLLNLTGNDFSNKKIYLFLDKFFNEPLSFIFGSLFLIKQFFVVPFSYWDPHHNTTSFMFVDFLYLRSLILFFFSIGIFSSFFYFLKNKDKESFFIFLFGVSLVLSQPLIYGGESRSNAVIIAFITIIIYEGVKNSCLFIENNLNFNIIKNNLKNKNKSRLNFGNKKIKSLSFLILATNIMPVILFVSLSNLSLSKVEDLYCKQGFKKSVLMFHSNSGFNLTHNLNKKTVFKNYGVDHFLDVYINHVSYLNTFTSKKINIAAISEKQILDRDKFKFLSYFNFLSTPRLFTLDNNQINNTYIRIFKEFSDGGGFFIYPINLDKGKKESIVVLPTDEIKEGINIVQICRQKT